jgi:hypothetical protein
MSVSKINIRKLKDFALEKFPRHFILRELLLDEREELSVAEFLSKLDLWLKLLKIENAREFGSLN